MNPDGGDNGPILPLREPKEEIEEEENESVIEVFAHLQKMPVPVYIWGMNDITVSKGEIIRIMTRIDHADKAEWLKDNIVMSVNHTPGVKTIKSRPVDCVFILGIDTAHFETSQIEIIARNRDEYIKKKLKLTIVEPEVRGPPVITTSLRDIIAKEGEEIELRVITKFGETFNWFINGRKVEHGENSSRISVQNNCKGTSSDLDLAPIKMEHAGRIKVFVSNDLGRAECAANFSVISTTDAVFPVDLKPIKKEEPDWDDVESAYPPPAPSMPIIVPNQVAPPPAILPSTAEITLTQQAWEWGQQYTQTLAMIQSKEAIVLPLLQLNPAQKAMDDCTQQHQSHNSRAQGGPSNGKKRRRHDEPSTSSAE